ncbi:hypothetical protein GCM10009001_34980 [Virgibacillus siamensis]|uniref:DUF2268 domain-containing protein n=1 Tax=Virgibacillus siamensis TaxID=480071 RepID=A0ABN1GMN1_9BACI
MKKVMMIIFLAMMVFLAGCENSVSKEKDDTQINAQQSNNKGSNQNEETDKQLVATAKNENGQTFHVISAYKLVDQYVRKIEDSSSESQRYELWQDIVVDQIQDRCFSGVYSHLVSDYAFSLPQDLGRIKSNNSVLKASNIEKYIMEALKTSAKKFPGPDTTVCLLPQDKGHFAGINVGKGKISVFYSSSFSETSVKSTVAHEYHHSTWTAKFGEDYKWDLLGSILFEGKAEYFASLVYGQTSTALYNYMSTEEEKKLWNTIKNPLHITDQEKIHNILYGGGKGFPTNFGYVAGYHIAREYAESHPNATIKEWSKLPPEELYKKSGYGD